jgi:preprotein translocase subunit SecG
MSILIGIATFILILVSLFLVLVVLMQKAKSDGGVGAAMGGGMAEATFGAETGNVLTTATIRAAIIFFVLSFLLYLGHIYQHKHVHDSGDRLPTMPASSLPATPAPVTAGAPAVVPDATPNAPATAPAATPAPVEEAKKP